jgi:hypothetical protein
MPIFASRNDLHPTAALPETARPTPGIPNSLRRNFLQRFSRRTPTATRSNSTKSRNSYLLASLGLVSELSGIPVETGPAHLLSWCM